MNSSVIWALTLCSPWKVSQHLGGTCLLATIKVFFDFQRTTERVLEELFITPAIGISGPVQEGTYGPVKWDDTEPQKVLK
jgi:hypothetical protein